MSAASAAPCATRASTSTSAATASSRRPRGGGALERAPARRLHRPAAPVAHLLRRQILRLSAEGVRGAAEPRRLHLGALHGLTTPGPRRRRSRPARTFHQWVRNQFGEKLFSIFFKTYTEKVWGMSCDEISADWAAQRIKGLSLGAAVIDGLKRSLGLNKAALGHAGRAGRGEDPDRKLPLSPPGPRHDVGDRARQGRGRGRRSADGPHPGVDEV